MACAPTPNVPDRNVPSADFVRKIVVSQQTVSSKEFVQDWDVGLTETGEVDPGFVAARTAFECQDVIVAARLEVDGRTLLSSKQRPSGFSDVVPGFKRLRIPSLVETSTPIVGDPLSEDFCLIFSDQHGEIRAPVGDI